MGQVPGDISRGKKIAMLEKDVPVVVSAWHLIGEKCAKSFRKDHHKRAERRFRHNANKEISFE